MRDRAFSNRLLFALASVCALCACGGDDGSSEGEHEAWRQRLMAAEDAAQRRQFDAAARHYRAAAAAIERAPDREELATGEEFARVLGGLARVHAIRGEVAKAESLYQRLLTAQTNGQDADHAPGYLIVGTLASLADLSLAREDYSRSESLYLQILSMKDEGITALEPHDDFLAYTLGGLGKTYSARGDSVRADSLAALSMGLMLYARAFDLYINDSYEQAEGMYLQALEIQTESTGHGSHLARTHHALGVLYDVQQRHQEALSMYRTAAEIYAHVGDPFERAAALEDLAALLRELQRDAAADSAESEVARIRRANAE